MKTNSRIDVILTSDEYYEYLRFKKIPGIRKDMLPSLSEVHINISADEYVNYYLSMMSSESTQKVTDHHNKVDVTLYSDREYILYYLSLEFLSDREYIRSFLHWDTLLYNVLLASEADVIAVKSGKYIPPTITVGNVSGICCLRKLSRFFAFADKETLSVNRDDIIKMLRSISDCYFKTVEACYDGYLT